MRNDWSEERMLDDRAPRPQPREELSSVDPQYEDATLPDLDDVAGEAS